jgi:hypothetical protein
MMKTMTTCGSAALVAVCLLSTAAGQAPAAPQQAPAAPEQPAAGRGRSAYQDAARLPVRIVSFTAEPNTIQRGQAVTLTWATENPGTITIEPNIGRVTPRGTRTISPAATTMYTLTATGVGGPVTRSLTVTIPGTVAAAAPAADPTSNAKKPVPRFSDGKPDFTGVYGYGQGGGGRGAPPPPADGGLPRTPTLKPGAEKYKVVRAPNDTGQYATCMPPGVPQTFFVPYYFQIVQAPKHVVILHEYLHLYRVIPTDGSAHPPDPDPTWMGNSVGRWEGDTLVVDSIGFNDKTEINGYRHTEALHVVERFKRPDADTLQYEATIEDPNVFAGPWLITRTFPFLPEHDSVDEFVCENNRDYRDLFGEGKK